MAERGLFGGVFARGDVDTGDQAWLTAMLGTEAALVRALTRSVPAAAAAAVHRGATSQDIIDTAAMLFARRALAAIAADVTPLPGSPQRTATR
jgi:hypothetical protein